MVQTRDKMIKSTAPDCARFLGYGGGNWLVFNWHRLEVRIPPRRASDRALDRASEGCIAMNEWDRDTLDEYAAVMRIRCTDLGLPTQ